MLTKNFAALHLCGFALNSRLARALALLLLLAIFAQGMAHIRHASITFDEGPHLATGYTTLRTGDLRLQPVHIHPPLANVWAAWPLLLQPDLPDPRAIDGWEIASLSAVTDAVVWQYPHPARLALASRLPILLLTVLLGALVCRWSKDLSDARAGLFALALLAFDPNIIAHGTLVTTDIAAVLLMVATLYVLNGRWQTANGKPRAGDWRRLVLVGALLGLAQLTKVSALMLVPVVGLLLLLAELNTQHATRNTIDISRLTFHVFRSCTLIFGTAALVLWAGYGFEVGRVSGFPLPLPAATHVRIFRSLHEHYELGHATFALGRVGSHGWWWYFPVAFLLKTPVPILLSIAYAVLRIAYCVLHPKHLTFDVSHLTLFIFPILYAASSLFSSVNIGYRHLLPLLPFLYIGISTAIFQPNRVRPLIRNTQYAIVAWLLLSTLAIAPDYLAFFNVFAGGPENGYRHLVDSNLDWGQNLWQLQDWMTEHAVERVYYAHYSPARPQVYGIAADFLPPDPRAVEFTPWRPAPGVYAIGATVLQGPYTDVNTYAWFRARRPTAQLGHALFVYEVEATTPPAWGVRCGDAPFSAERLRAQLALPDLRVLWLDCAQASVYPAGGLPGVRLARAEEIAPPAATVELVLRSAEGNPEYALYRLPGAAPQPETRLPQVAVEGPLDFLGYTLNTGDAAIVLEAHWRVREIPGRPLSLLAHLVGPEGTGVAVGDGLGFPIEQWRTYDIIVQRHHLTIPEDVRGENYTIHIGGYWLDTLERWPVIKDGQGVDDKIIVSYETR